MAIKNSIYNDFKSTFIKSINVLDCCLSGVRTLNKFHTETLKNLTLSCPLGYFAAN